MMRNTLIAIALGAALAVMSAGSAHAVPTLQLYSPDATYDTETESWVTVENPFELWVVGAKTPEWVTLIENVTLFVAMPEEYYGKQYPGATEDVVINITGIDSTDTNAYIHSGFSATLTTSSSNYHENSTPPWPGSSGDFPPHDVYPADYWDVSLPNLLYWYNPDTGKYEGGYYGEDIYNYDQNFDPNNLPDPPPDIGDIQFYEVSYTVPWDNFLIQFDVIGEAHNSGSKWTFAPFSHDVQAMPEPATLMLLATGVSALGLEALRRKRRRRT